MRSFIVGFAVAAAIALPSNVLAQTGVDSLDSQTVRAVVDQVIRALRQSYVFPRIGERYAAGLAEQSRTYPAIMSISELSARVTSDLQAVHPDRHLQLRAAPPAQRVGGGVRRVVAGQGGAAAPPPSGAQARVQVGAEAEGPAAPLPPDPDQLYSPIDLTGLPDVAQSLFRDEATRNHFFRAVEVLPGNVGYIDYDQFGFPNFSTQAADAAFAFLRETDAMIIDLRGNRGGIEGMNQYLASHFFGEQPVHLYSRYYGSSQATFDYPTYPSRVKHRFPEVPLFILVDSGTGSAAENFAYALQGLGRATIVGEATAGAAHSSTAVSIEPGLLLQLPIARAFNPRTNEDWEQVGVLPDVAADPESALGVAHAAAIDVLLESAGPNDRLTLEDAKLLMAARSLSSSDQGDYDSYLGEYGTRRVFTEDGVLKMVRTDVHDASPVDLVPLGPDYFTLKQAAVARIRFERNEAGMVLRLHVRLPTGSWEISERRAR
jgi:hypothetical protein